MIVEDQLAKYHSLEKVPKIDQPDNKHHTIVGVNDKYTPSDEVNIKTVYSDEEAVEIEARNSDGDILSKIVVSGSNNPQGVHHAVYPWENVTTDLGKDDYRFNTIWVEQINHMFVNQIQRLTDFRRIQNDGSTGDILDSDINTDIFAYQGKLIFKEGFTGRQIKSFFVNKGFTLENDGGPVIKINVDFEEKALPYTAENKMHLVGYTQYSDNTVCPLFQTETPIIPPPTLENAGKSLTVNETGTAYILA